MRQTVLAEFNLSGTSSKNAVTLSGGAAGAKGLLYAARDVSLRTDDTSSYVPDEPLSLIMVYIRNKE